MPEPSGSILKKLEAAEKQKQVDFGTVDEKQAEQSFRNVYPELFETAEDYQSAIDAVRQLASAFPEAFVSDISGIGRTKDSENVLRYIGADDLTIDDIFYDNWKENLTSDKVTAKYQPVQKPVGALTTIKPGQAEYVSPDGRTRIPYPLNPDTFTMEQMRDIQKRFTLVTVKGKFKMPELDLSFDAPDWYKEVNRIAEDFVTTPLTVGGVQTLSLSDVAAIGLIALGIYEVGSYGWNTLLNYVGKKDPRDLNAVGNKLYEYYMRRELGRFEKLNGVTLDKATRNNFINSFRDWAAGRYAGSVNANTSLTTYDLQRYNQQVYNDVQAVLRQNGNTLIPALARTGVQMGGREVPNIESVAQKLIAGTETTAQDVQFYADNAQAVEAKIAELRPPAVVEPVVKEPWQMTKKEWDAEFEKTKPDYTGGQAKGIAFTRATSEKGLGIVFQKIQERQQFLKMGLPDKNIEGLQIPARHYDVIEKALSEGKPIPAEVLKDYPDLQPTITHRGTEPEGIAIANELGIAYDGIQEGFEGEVGRMQFTDPQTGSTTYGNTLEEVRTALAGMREKFGVQPEAVEAVVPETPEQIQQMTDAKLKQTIMAWVKTKGITKTQYQKTLSELTGRTKLGYLNREQLENVLSKVKELRPVRIKNQKVITPKTEKKIQTLKQSLISSKKLDEKTYNQILARLNLKTDRYETSNRFITESKAKELIRAMNDEAVLAKWDISVNEALAENPQIRTVVDRLNRQGTPDVVVVDGEPVKLGRGNELWSMRYYMLNLQKKLGAPVYDVWQKINNAHLIARDRYNQQLARLEATTPKFSEIAADEEALKRIEDYIASKNNLMKIKAPELNEDELAIANELERGYFEARNDVRFIRFLNAYAENDGSIDKIADEIPNAPRRALRRAIDIYEGKGEDALRKFTDTQTWGVIESGYDPRTFIKPVLKYAGVKGTTFSKGLLRTRSGIEYQKDDSNVIQRYSRYQKQLIALQELSSLIRSFERVYADAATKLEPQALRDSSKVIARNFNEMKGYHEDGGFIIHALDRLYGQVATAVFWRPDLALRNKFQNFAMNTDYWKGRFADPRNKPLTEEELKFFEVFVSQERMLQADYLMQGEKAFRGLDRLSRLARRTSAYGWSDRTNRAEAFYVRMNRVKMALESYRKTGDVEKLIKDSGLDELEPRQQAYALEMLAMDKVDFGIDMPPVSGEEAFALYNAREHTNNVHFLYDRSQRAPAEQGAAGKTLGNILVFSRSWGERFVLQGRKLDPKADIPFSERAKAAKVIIGLIVAGMITGTAYTTITGKKNNPYNPLNILTWSPGGLSLSVATEISDGIYTLTQAVQGDESALSKIPGILSQVSEVTLPFYRNFVQAAESITGLKDIDKLALRRVRELIDDEYEVRGGDYEIDRTVVEALQHGLFGGYDEPQTNEEKAQDAILKLGTEIPRDDIFSLEKQKVYGTGNLGGRFSQIYGDGKVDDIPLAQSWSELRRVEESLSNVPDKKLYEITTLSSDYKDWASRHSKEISLIEDYNRLTDDTEKRQFLKDHPEIAVNPIEEFLKSHPKENALYALWNKSNLYSVKAYDEYVRMYKELNIIESSLPYYFDSREHAQKYFEYSDIVREFGGSSSEAKLYRYDNDFDEVLNRQRDVDLEPVGDARILRINVDYSELDDKYESYGDKTSDDYIEDDKERQEARDKLLEDETDYRIARRQRDFYRLAPDASDEVRDAYVEFYSLPDSGYWKERYLVRNPELETVLLDNEKRTEAVDPTTVPDIRYDLIYEQYRNLFEQYDDASKEAKKVILEQNPDFQQARWERDGYKTLIGKEELVDDYVGYMVLEYQGKPDNVDNWFEDDWYLLEHPEFYRAMTRLYKSTEGKQGFKSKEYNGSESAYWERIPSRKIYSQWITYDNIIGDETMSAAEARRQYRRTHPEFDAWGVIFFGWKPIEQYDLDAGKTTAEQYAESRAAKRKIIDDLQKEIEEKLRGLEVY